MLEKNIGILTEIQRKIIIFTFKIWIRCERIFCDILSEGMVTEHLGGNAL